MTSMTKPGDTGTQELQKKKKDDADNAADDDDVDDVDVEWWWHGMGCMNPSSAIHMARSLPVRSEMQPSHTLGR